MKRRRQRQEGKGYGFFWGLLCLGVCLGTGSPALAAQPWTLAQCLEYALTHSPSVREALAEVQIAESQLTRAKAGRFPRVSFTSLNGIINGARGDAVTGQVDNGDLGPFTKGELEVVQPLYTFGRLRAEIQAALKGIQAKRAATEQTRDAVIAQVKELYYTLVFSRQIRKLLAEVQKNFAKALKVAEERLETGEGEVTQQDVLKLRIGLAGVTKEVFALERAIAVTRSALMRQLGLPPEAEFAIADTRLKPVELRLQPLPTYLQQAFRKRPEFIRLTAGLEARRARVQAARSAYYPSLFLAGGIRYAVAPNREDQESPFARDDFNFFHAGMVLGLRWQLDFWMTQAKVTERLAEVAKVEIQKQNAAAGIALEIRRRYLEVQENQQKLEAAQTARKAARALMVTSLANFTLGVGEAKDVFDSLGLYTRMAAEYYQTVRDLNIATARLSQATGQEVTTLTYQR